MLLGDHFLFAAKVAMEESSELLGYLFILASAVLANSDKRLNFAGYGNPPLAYTVFVRYLVEMCKEKGLIPLEDAIRRITSLPASIMNLSDRGQIAEGMQADLVLLDWENLSYTVDYNNPSIPAKGIRYVFVNGMPAMEEGELTKAATGKLITKQS